MPLKARSDGLAAAHTLSQTPPMLLKSMYIVYIELVGHLCLRSRVHDKANNQAVIPC